MRKHSVRRTFHILLVTVACVCGILLCARALLGPFHFFVPVQRTLNLQSAFGLASTLALLLGRGPQERRADSLQRHVRFNRVDLLLACLVVVAAVAAFYANLRSFFLSDDFYLLTIAHDPDTYGRALFLHGGGQEFFRPFGGMALLISSWFAGFSPLRWHGISLAIHSLNGVLVYTLARQLFTQRSVAGIAAALFCLHGITPESVAWVAGRFDILATFFTLFSLVCFVAKERKGNSGLYIASLVAGALALLTKESAYVLPALITTILVVSSASLKDALLRTGPYWLLAVSMFLLRYSVLGGIGGYSTAGGTPQVLSFNPLGIVKAVGLRIWSAFYIPVNWSVEPSFALTLTMLAGATVIVCVIVFSTPRLTDLRLAAALCVAATAPALHQLLIDTDLQRSRMLYLPLAGFCLFLGVALGSLRSPRFQGLAALLLIAFHWAALQHNLKIWRTVSELADSVCGEIVATVPPTAGGVDVEGLPGSLKGVYFLRNGLGGCLDLKAGRPLGLQNVSQGPGSVVLRWADLDAVQKAGQNLTPHK